MTLQTPHLAPTAQAVIVLQTRAILLDGGWALLFFESAGSQPPGAGQLVQTSGVLSWTADVWPCDPVHPDRWCGLALLDGLPEPDAVLCDPAGGQCWQFNVGSHIEVAAQALHRMTQRAGVGAHGVFAFLARHLIAALPADAGAAQGHRLFVHAFLMAAAERDGFIEILAVPDGGGLFVQGWSQSIGPDAQVLPEGTGTLAMRAADIAQFDRDDILAPACGFCFFDRGWSGAAPGGIGAVFFERGGQLFRLDVAAGSSLQLQDAAATAHVAHMLPRLRAAQHTLASFKRICRPRFAGEDTLTGTPLPVAAGFDAVLRAPDGTLLVLGWLLDPTRRVRTALIKSTEGRYARISATWVLLPRPDLNIAFADSPRFAGVIDPQDAMHGFVAHALAGPQTPGDRDVYLELELEDGSCLFQPLRVTAFPSAERLAQVLAAIAPNEPMLGRIIADHLAPFLASVRPVSPAVQRGGAVPPIRLGEVAGQRDVAALMPLRAMADLQPVLALLAGTPDAAALDLTLIVSRGVAADLLKPLEAAFLFYDLAGSLVIAPDHANIAAALDIGVSATAGSLVLRWLPAALPKSAGWLARLLAEAASLPDAGAISPALTYGDGSICFGAPVGGNAVGRSVAGYGQDWLHRGAPAPVATAATEIALIDRALLARCGGFSGQVFSNLWAQHDLAARLAQQGALTWCSGQVEFWMLDDAAPRDDTPFVQMMQQVDAALLARRAGAAVSGGPR